MSIKSTVLHFLEENRESPVSGQDIAEYIGVTRAAVWKAIKKLQNEGHKIGATTNRGYTLQRKSDVISKEGIEVFLSSEDTLADVVVHKVIDSTNSCAKKLAVDGATHGTLVVADEQTHGRGRMGRSFYSPPSTGIYMSIILRPDREVSEMSTITCGVAVAVCNVIERLTLTRTTIKWVNDIYINEKKVCGILTEAVTDFETGMIEYIVVGIGINVKTEEFPDELKNKACSAFILNFSRNEIIAKIAKEVQKVYNNVGDESIIQEYKNRSFLLGKEIIYYKKNESFKAIAVDVNNDGNLIVKDENDQFITLKSGEVSLSSNNMIN